MPILYSKVDLTTRFSQHPPVPTGRTLSPTRDCPVRGLGCPSPGGSSIHNPLVCPFSPSLPISFSLPPFFLSFSSPSPFSPFPWPLPQPPSLGPVYLSSREQFPNKPLFIYILIWLEFLSWKNNFLRCRICEELRR